MRILHTSDWHIGRTLYGRKRYEEFESFLTWLAEMIQQNGIDALLVAGDVFDTSARVIAPRKSITASCAE